MFRHALTVAAAIGIALTAAPAIAQTVEHDVRCMILSEAFSKLEKDPAKKQVAAATGLYFFGRVDAQISGTALRSQFFAQRALLRQQNAGEVMTACAKDFMAHQHDLQTSLQGVIVATPPKKCGTKRLPSRPRRRSVFGWPRLLGANLSALILPSGRGPARFAA